MVDRQARDAAALVLRRLASGRITNDEFEEQYPPRHSDPAVEMVWWFVWSLYNGFDSYRLVGPHELSRELRTLVARTVLFLQSNHEYEWPPVAGLAVVARNSAVAYNRPVGLRQ